jgi:hypothetical protein
VTSREERVARNESVSREINEAIEDAKSDAPSEDYLRIVCECGRPDCNDLLAITHAEYQDVRSDPRRFAVQKDHARSDIESVVSETDRFTVVQKREGTPAEVAEALDPRT